MVRVLLLHNYYQERGGEDLSFERERDLLAAAGHDVDTYVVHNRELAGMGFVDRARTTFWNPASAERVAAMVSDLRPDVAHVHNLLPLLSPSVLEQLDAFGVPTVATLHNFRLTCANGMLLRDGRPCELCVGRRVAVHGIRFNCYRGDKLASAAVVGMIGLHNVRRDWSRWVDRFIVTSTFAREKLADLLPTDRVDIKPSIVHPDPGPGPGGGGFALFVGRLKQEKGARLLLDAWKLAGAPLPLVVVGSGPEEHELRSRAGASVRFVGEQDTAGVNDFLGRAEVLVLPSITYEGSPLVVAEAAARGTPAVVPTPGGASEMVTSGVTGWTFPIGDVEQLAAVVGSIASRPDAMAEMRHAVRQAYEERFSGQAGLGVLERTYKSARRHREARSASPPAGS